MRERGRFSRLFLIILVVMGGVVALGSYSYRSASQLAARNELSVESSNRVLCLKLIDRLEKVIIDSDRTFFKLVSLDDPREFMELWRRIIRVSPAVQAVMVLDEHRQLAHFVAKLADPRRSKFRQFFLQRIIPDLELHKLPTDEHKHLHKDYGTRSYLFSYIRRHSAGRAYYIVLHIDIDHLTQEILPEEFKGLETRSIAVMDDGGRVIYGRPVATDSRMVSEERFPTTLYKWRLQVAPRDVAAIRRQARAQRLSDLVLVVMSLTVILIGMLLVLLAVRQEHRANALKSEFIANVSHELKTPLSLIRMFAELLASGRVTDRKTTTEYAEIITRESVRLTGLIDNVLDFARIERGKAAYEFQRLEVGPIIERAVELCQYRADQAQVKLRAEVAKAPPTLVDENALTLLLLNLIENALKYGSREGSEIRVTLEHDGAASRLLITVSDDGPGIAPEDERRIFERFYRGQTARTMSVRGSGIGLSLVKHIAEAHGGRVRLMHNAVTGRGATFVVSIPIR